MKIKNNNFLNQKCAQDVYSVKVIKVEKNPHFMQKERTLIFVSNKALKIVNKA